jgi:signal recognition particle receptor subunit beta
MVLFNHATREMTAKIVYYGPGLCGKTTNLLVIFDKLDPKNRGKMLSLATKTDRTLFFDLLPVDIGKVGNFNLKIQLYTVPGQVFYNETRKLVLKGADSVVFVADSQPSMVDSNRESFANLIENLEQNNIDPNDIPIVIQYNKRDIPGVLSVEELAEKLDFNGYPSTEASAILGDGVMETFKLATKVTAKHLITKLGGKGAKADLSMPKEKESKAKKAEAAASKAKPKAAPAPPPEPEPPPAPAFNPFADSMPFPEEAAPVDQGYEAMEEVSLEQLLEGRDRPATMSGNVAVPVTIDEPEEVEELAESDAIALEETPPPIPVSFEDEVEEEPLPVAVADEPAAEAVAAPAGNGRIEELESEVAQLREELSRLRAEHDAILDDVALGLTRLQKLVQR